MAQESGPMSGFRDLLAEQMLPRQAMLDTVRNVYESYGFVPLKTPALERYETMTGKYGEEGEKLMYDFYDNGNRHVAMRYDQTVPLARVVAQHGSRLPAPYKRYALGDVWRGDSPQAGRYREFTQFDADTVGSDSYLADTEIVAMMSDAMRALGLDTVIRVNDRKILDGLAKAVGIEGEKDFRYLVGLIDKIDKVGAAAILAEVDDNLGNQARQVVGNYLGATEESQESLVYLDAVLQNDEAGIGIDNLTNIFSALKAAGYNEPDIVFDPTIARGLDYYTGTIYETTLNGAKSLGSVCSGGRFDNLIEEMGGPPNPAVGTSIGVDRLLEGMDQLGKLSLAKTSTEVFVANLGGNLDAQRFAITQTLRQAGIPAELVLREMRLGKQFQAIEKLGVSKVILLGENEAEAGIVQLKDLEAQTQTAIPLANLVEYLQNGDEQDE